MDDSRWWNNAAWMSNANVHLAMVVMASALPVLIADLSTDKLSWLTCWVMLANILVAAKAFMTDPQQVPAKVVQQMTAAVDDVKTHVNDKVDEVADEITKHRKK